MTTDDARRRQLAADGVMSLRAAAEFLGVSLPTVERLVRRGELASTKVGWRRQVSKRACVEYLTKAMTVPE